MVAAGAEEYFSPTLPPFGPFNNDPLVPDDEISASPASAESSSPRPVQVRQASPTSLVTADFSCWMAKPTGELTIEGSRPFL